MQKISFFVVHCKSLKSFFAGCHYQEPVTAWHVVPEAGWELDDNLSPAPSTLVSLCYAVPPEEDGGRISWWISFGPLLVCKLSRPLL